MVDTFDEKLREDLKIMNECAPLWPALTTVLEAATRYLRVAEGLPKEIEDSGSYAQMSIYHRDGQRDMLARVRELMSDV